MQGIAAPIFTGEQKLRSQSVHIGCDINLSRQRTNVSRIGRHECVDRHK